MGKEIIGSFIMALAGFFLMIAIEGKILETIFRVSYLLLSVFTFYFGMKFYRQFMPKESLSSKDWLVIMLSILTPFIVVSMLESLGILFGGIGILVWLTLAALVIVKTEKVVDALFPKIEKENSYKNEELRRRLNPGLYPLQTKKDREGKKES